MAFLRAALRSNRRFVAMATSSSLALIGCASTAAWRLDEEDNDHFASGGGTAASAGPLARLRRTVARGVGNSLAFCDGDRTPAAALASSQSSSSSLLLLQQHAALLGSPDDSPIRRSMVELLTRMQLQIRDHVNALERQHTPAGETPVAVVMDVDDRHDEGKRGIAMVIQGGRVIEKGGFSITVMSKPLSAGMARQMSSNHEGLRKRLDEAAAADKAAMESGLSQSAAAGPSQSGSFKMWVCGLSLILHPKHPLGATVHLNYRCVSQAGDNCTRTPTATIRFLCHATMRGACHLGVHTARHAGVLLLRIMTKTMI
jgi:hypothetical protein